MPISNPPPVKVPAKLLQDPELRDFFRSLTNSFYLLWERVGAGTGLTPIESGGTGEATAAAAGAALGIEVGVDVQAFDADLTAIAALATTDGNVIVGNGSAWVAESGATARTSLGLGAANDVTFNDLEVDGDLNHDGTTVGFYGATPVAQASALTTQLTTITHTAPGTPDYALQDLTTTTPFGFVTKDEGNTLLSVVANLQARVAELEAALDASTGVGIVS